MSEPTILTIAVCLFNRIANLDYEGPMELFGYISPELVKSGYIQSSIALQPTYFAPTREPFRGGYVGPMIIPDRAYHELEDREQFDIILVPGGLGTRPNVIHPSIFEFLRRQAPGAKYVLSVCTGSWVLAQAGLLTGRRATSNKGVYKQIADWSKEHNQSIEWVPKARWVVDGNFWTSSGVTAGIDMAHAFLLHLVGEDVTKRIRGIVEANIHEADNDPYAEFHGMV